MVSDSRTITEAGRLHDPHAGGTPASVSVEPLESSVADPAATIGLPAAALSDVSHGRAVTSADPGLRLARRVGSSGGFFLRPRDGHGLGGAEERLGGAPDQIVPRAA